mmetsp:Transcript_39791/g.109571  ORF Transcript_39791/g.109571 Transcript_39791/m.109571 type:complete len:204 (+) Transcript_39791:1055-1666(+)
MWVIVVHRCHSQRVVRGRSKIPLTPTRRKVGEWSSRCMRCLRKAAIGSAGQRTSKRVRFRRRNPRTFMAVVAPKLDRTVPLKIHRDPIIVLNARWQPEIFLGDISMHAVLIAAPIHVLSVAETTSSVARVPPGLVLERRICAVRHKVVPISARLLCYLFWDSCLEDIVFRSPRLPPDFCAAMFAFLGWPPQRCKHSDGTRFRR